MEAQEFYLVATHSPGMAITAGDLGRPVSLQIKSEANLRQRWVMQAKVSDRSQGVAFVNPHTRASVTYTGEGQDLIMREFRWDSHYPDAWLLMAAHNGNVRIAYIKDARWAWHDHGGAYLPGDRIVTYQSAGTNSEWTIQPVRPFTSSEDTIAVPALVGEPAEATV